MRAAVDAGVDGIKADCGGLHDLRHLPRLSSTPAWADRLPAAFVRRERDARHDGRGARRPNSRLSCQIVLDEELDGLDGGLPDTQY